MSSTTRRNKKAEQRRAKRQAKRGVPIPTDKDAHTIHTPKEASPQFDFTEFDKNYPPAANSSGGVPFCKICKRLKGFEGMTWEQVICEDGGDLYHACSTSHRKFDKKAKKLLVDAGHADLDELPRFQIDRVGRLWGRVIGGIFYPRWWDPKHEIWKTGK